MNLLAGTTDNPEAFGEAFNVAVGGRNTLNELYKIINDNLVKQFKINNSKFKIPEGPVYRDFRAGDIRHSNADITKAKTIVGYAPTHDIYEGMEEAIEWYIENIGKKSQ